MTVGEVIALLCKYCSNEDYLLMCRSIYNIEVCDNNITVFTIDANSPDIIIQTNEV